MSYTIWDNSGNSQGQVSDDVVDELLSTGFIERCEDGRLVLTQAGRDEARLKGEKQ